MHLSHPLVSIVIPCYNSRLYVVEAVESCLAQTYPHCEVIVVDDGSTDGTGDLLNARYADRIRYLRQANAGPAAARNRGIEAAQGAFIQFCDADDQLLPVKIERSMAVFGQQPDLGAVYTRYQYVSMDGKTPLPMADPPLLSGDIFCDLLLSNANAILTSAVLARRDALIEAGLFDERKDFWCAEDWDLFLRLASRYRFAAIDEVLVLYRHHPASLKSSAYWSAAGRLITVQKARHYPGRQRCLDDAAYDRLEAARHHMMALAHWRKGNRVEARREFREAMHLNPAQRRAERRNIVLTYILPASAQRLVQRLIQRLRKPDNR